MAELSHAPLETRGLTKRFGATLAVDGIHFAVRRGEVHALVGENGAGKTTLMNILSGVERADSGSMWLDGEPYLPATPRHARSRGVVMVHQELALAPHLSVADNLFLGIEPTRGAFLRRRDMRNRAADALASLDHEEVDPDASVGNLPIAARQIVEIARAIVAEARILILDEPTSCLSRPDIEKLFELIGRLKQRGLGIVYISHFLEEVVKVADVCTVLRDGRTVLEGSIEEIPLDEMVRAMVGREVDVLYPRSHRATGEVLLVTESLCASPLPRSASLELRRGEVLGVAGLMGAGRTELLRTIFGLERVRGGQVRVGLFAGPATPRERLHQGVGMSSEDRQGEGLALGRSISSNLTLSRLDGLGPFGLVLPARMDAAARVWVERLAIHCRSTSEPVGSLSGGNQQKVALARLLYRELDLLLLDEPTRGIDVGAKATIYALIDDLAARGKAVLLVSSYLPELLGMADRIAVMNRGVLGDARPVSGWNEVDIMAAAVDVN